MVRDGQPATPAQLPSTNKQHMNPSHTTLQPLFDTCGSRGIEARLESKMVDVAVKTRLICSATVTSATATAERKHGKKRPEN
jgi:hypothetical protein